MSEDEWLIKMREWEKLPIQKTMAFLQYKVRWDRESVNTVIMSNFNIPQLAQEYNEYMAPYLSQIPSPFLDGINAISNRIFNSLGDEMRFCGVPEAGIRRLIALIVTDPSHGLVKVEVEE